ncbi:MAG: GNAT family N-acetyltransferase [Chloroflexota bacterium]
MIELNKNDYERVRPLFRKSDLHLPLQAILAGNVNSQIFVDNTDHPQTAVTWTGYRFFLTGVPGNTELIAEIRKIFLEKYSLSAWKEGIDSYVLYYPNEKWEDFIKPMLAQKSPISSVSSYYSRKTEHVENSNLPEEFSSWPIDASLLSKTWSNKEFLTDELVSERKSIEEFLEKSFGICVTREDMIVGWCVSEYNTGHRCEIGISTHKDYRQQGLASWMTREFINTARSKDIARLGWHSKSANIGSAATALACGFEKVQDYPVYFGWFDDAINLANNGYFAHTRGDNADALGYYEKSIKIGDAPDWAYWGAACEAAIIGNEEKGFNYLFQAIEHGFDSVDQITQSEYFSNFHSSEKWQEVLKKLK